MTINLKVILGSTRQGRFGEKPAQWILDEAAALPDVAAELLDLRDYPLPHYDEPTAPMAKQGKYDHPVVQRWADKIAEGDAFVIVSPEYNHGYPGVLKNAMDYIYPEWVRKPVSFLSYGSTGGARAVEQLRQVAIELQMWPMRSALHLPVTVYMAVVKEPVPVNPDLFKPMKEGRVNQVERFFNELLWAARVLKAARSENH